MEHERQAHFKRDGEKLIGLSDESIRKHIRAGRLAAERVGVRGLYRIEPADVKALAMRYNYPLDEELARELEQ